MNSDSENSMLNKEAEQYRREVESLLWIQNTLSGAANRITSEATSFAGAFQVDLDTRDSKEDPSQPGRTIGHLNFLLNEPGNTGAPDGFVMSLESLGSELLTEYKIEYRPGRLVRIQEGPDTDRIGASVRTLITPQGSFNHGENGQGVYVGTTSRAIDKK